MQEQMSTHGARIVGTETEFGIAGKDSTAADPVSGSIAVIAHYPGLPAPTAIWDYEHENPLLDARGFEVDGEKYIGISTHSPIFQAMSGKSKGDTFSLKQKKYMITDIF